MKLWKLETTVDSEDEMTADNVLRMIDRDVNRGDGIYVRVVEGVRPLRKRIKLLRKVKE